MGASKMVASKMVASKTVVKACLAAGVAGITMMSAGFAQAQLAEEIVVTGTRIKQKNVLATSPIVTLSSEDIATRGVTRIEDLINELPQVFASQGSRIANGATGIATANLRGLGSERTLVLIDGRRMASGTVNQIAADLNQIPAALVKNVDVLTGGSGAVYGSDALGGVVNFQMERNFEGLRLDAQIGAYQHNNNNKALQSILSDAGELTADHQSGQLDGLSRDITFVFGKNFDHDKGNITAYLGYRKIDGILQSQRDYSGCALGGGQNADGKISCLGSSFSASGLFSLGILGTANNFFTIDPATGNTFQPVSDQSGSGLAAVPRFNFAASNNFQRPDERFTGGIFAHYDLGYSDSIYFDIMYADDRSTSQTAPSANFFSTNLISCDNPFLSDQQRGVICTARGFGPDDDASLLIGRRNVEGEARRDFLHHTSFRANIGLRGVVRPLRGFEYDISAQYSSTDLERIFRNDLSVKRMQRALLATTGIDGNPVCDSVLDGSDPNCVPINYFQTGGITQAALDYIGITGLQNGNYNQTIILASVAGNLGEYGLQIPGTDSGAKIVLGGEFRKDDYTREASDGFLAGDLAGFASVRPRLSGNYNSLEAFGEIQFPILQARKLAKDVTLNGAFRFADNSISGNASSYALGGTWQVNDSFRFRGQYQRAVRVANAVELFLPVDLDGGIVFADPCQGAAPSATQIQCANSGVTSAQYGNIPINPDGRLNVLAGGSFTLEPEISDTLTLGAIIQFPPTMPDINFSFDYFDITVNDFIGNVSPSTALTDCIEENNPLLCKLIKRDTTSGALWTNNSAFIDATNVNTGKLATSGFDFSATYEGDLPIGWGGLSARFNSTYLLDYSVQALPNGSTLKCAGLYGGGCGTPNARWRHIAALTWQTDKDLDARISWRHFASVNAQEILNAEPGSFDASLAAADYFDVAVTYRGLSNATLRLGINNVFDAEPPLSSSTGAGFGNGNTFPQVYDALGRFLFARITIDY